MNYRRFGKGSTVVLQHGFLGGSGYWSTVTTELGRIFDVITPDLPGFAGSGEEPYPDSIAGYAETLIRFLDSLGIYQFSLVGHSMGGMIAQQIALDYPTRLRRLVLYGTAPSGHLQTRFETFEETIVRFTNLGPAAADDVVASWFIDRKEHPLYHYTLEAGRGFSVPSAINAMTIVPKWDVRDRLAEIAIETLVIAADRDLATTPKHAFALWKAIPNSHLCIIPGCSHAIHLEKATLFNEVLRQFLLTGH